MSAEKKLVKEWSVAYRLNHWLVAISIFVLAFTGYYIHWPFIVGNPDSVIMGWMRFLHFFFMYALVLALVWRLYLAFFSRSPYTKADWREFGLIRNAKEVPGALKYYLFLSNDHGPRRRYNALQALAYLFLAVCVVWMALTGFAIYHGSFFGFVDSFQAFGWVNNLLGGELHTRVWHFGTMWVILIIFMIHKYLGVRQTLMDKDGVLASIFTGNKWDNV